MTPAASTLQFELDARFRWFQNEWFFKWHFIGKDGPVEIDMFDGNMATMGGIAFSGTARDVFWDAVVRGAKREVEERVRWIDAEVRRYEAAQIDVAIDECIGQLISFVERVQRKAVEKFRILCGDGVNFPSPVDHGVWPTREEVFERGAALKRAVPREQDQLDALVLRPTESISVELKTWIDPRTPDGVAKIVKAGFALRNRNGGYLLVGFDDRTGAPDPYPFAEPVSDVFHVDVVQQIVSKYAAQVFPIELALRNRDGQPHPVVVVPPGVRVPAVVKAALIGEGGKRLLREGEVYFRTLRSNGAPSSAAIMPGDWPDLMDVCFNNREGDIGGFFRRQLGGVERDTLAAVLREVVGAPLMAPNSREALRERAEEVIGDGWAAFDAVIAKRSLSEVEARAVKGLTMHVGLAFDPERPDALPTRAFLDTVAGANPQYTGWPMWLDARSFSKADERPVVRERAWETLIVEVEDSFFSHLEFMRMDPRGTFYLRRAMQDDLTDKVAPGTAMDVFLMLIRVAEALVVGLAMGRALEWPADGEAGFAFVWDGLSQRRLSGWANPMRSLGMGGGTSHADQVSSAVRVPLETPAGALAPYVSQAVAPLFSVFDGYQPATAIVEDAVARLLERRLS
jgi:hypothetical protein